MKCPLCNGDGYVKTKTILVGGVPWGITCSTCNGTGEIKDETQTNDEWRRTCSAEEFSEWLEEKLARIEEQIKAVQK